MSDPSRTYGGKSAAERAAERRVRLIDAVVEVLADQGERTTMTQVCAAAGLTERYFYESFACLDDAKAAALDSVGEEILTLATTTIENAVGSPEARVHAVMVAFVDLVQAAPAKVKVAAIHSSGNPRLRARRHELMGVFADFVAREGDELYGESAWPADRARIHGLVYIAGFTELVAAWLTGEVSISAEELVETAENMFAGLLRRG